MSYFDASTANKSLRTLETTHKQTVADLQRARAATEAVRTAHYNEIKRIEMETQQMRDRWQKIADNQAKLGAQASGFRHKFVTLDANPPKDTGKSLVEQALEEAERSRRKLLDLVYELRHLVAYAVNGLSSRVYSAKQALQPDFPDASANNFLRCW